MYSAVISVNGVKGYVGGSDISDLVDGVKACAEAIEQATANVQDIDCADDLNDCADDLNDYDDDLYDYDDDLNDYDDLYDYDDDLNDYDDLNALCS